jgi:CRP-like cAMP-binding protein
MAIDQVVVASLLRVPVFSELKPLQIAEIGRGAQRCTFGRGEVIVRAGTPGNTAFLILSGEAGCRMGPEPDAALEPIEPGSLIGELAMFVEHVYGATVVANGWVECLQLDRRTLYRQMRADPDMASRFADTIRGRLTQVATELRLIEQLLASVGQGQPTRALLSARSAPVAAGGPP